jgi:predicted MFS family arabinose efflux permease
MLRTYRAVFRAPGSAAFAAAGFVMRMPIAIYPIGLVLIVSARTGHYGFAGVASAVYIAGGIPGAPLLSRLVDHYGQRALLIPSTAVHVAAVIVLAVLLESGAPDWTLLPPIFLAGFAYMSVGSLIRARWSLALAGRPEMATAYSLESILDEVIFVIGPLVATLIATNVDPVIVLYVSIALVTAGALWLASQRRTQPPAHPAGSPRHPSALRSKGIPLLTVATVFMGVVFAGAELSMIAFCGQHGHRSLSGLVVALFAGGSGVAGFVYGARTWRQTVLWRFRLQSAVFGILPLLFLIPRNVPVLAVCSFVVGLAIAPMLITSFALVERLVPGPALTEGLSWVLTGLNVGYGAGAAVVGAIADAHGARTSFWVAIAAAVAVAVTAALTFRTLRASDEGGQPSVGASEHAALP